MTGPVRLACALVLAGIGTTAIAIPPPPPPISSLPGGTLLCNPHYAIMLNDDEAAVQYSPDHWVVSGPNLSFGIRAHDAAGAAALRDALHSRGQLENISIPALAVVDRYRVTEQPGNRPWGWTYWFRRNEAGQANYVSIASERFVGSDADYSILRRVLFGEERRNLCAPQTERG